MALLVVDLHMDRRSRFRAFMKALDPTGNPEEAVNSGFYVPALSQAGRRIAASLELESSSSHLLLGGIGSGKTTELIRIQQELDDVDDLIVVRVDVPEKHQLDKLKPGVLLALTAIELYRHLPPADDPDRRQRLRSRVRILTVGSWEYDPYADYDPNPGVPKPQRWVPGVLETPRAEPSVAKLTQLLRELLGLHGSSAAVLFDGLDRVLDLAPLTSMLFQDLPALKSLGIGCVIVGPPHLQLSEHRAVIELFTRFHRHGAVDWLDEAGQRFLVRVLRARVAPDILSDEAVDQAASLSGGLTRDLISLVRSAGEDAYAGGAVCVNAEHIKSAADQLGRNLLFGVTQTTAAQLRALAPQPKIERVSGVRVKRMIYPDFVPASDDDVSLLLRRLIIEISTAPPTYRLHPAVLPLLSGLRRTA